MTATVTLRLQADASGAIRGVSLVKAELGGLAGEAGKAGAAGQRAGGQIASGMRSADNAAEGLNRTLRTLSNLGAVWASFAGGRAVVGDLVRTADAMQGLNGRLRIVTKSAEEYAAAQVRIREIAFSTSNALESVGTLYTRLTQASESLGFSQEKVANITESVALATRLSGGAAESAAAGVQQLAQSFASGVLSGDEFRSVMENSPRLVKAMTDSFGVGVGELRKLAEEQKLSAELVAEAILLQQRAMREEMTSFPPTVSAALTQVQNSWAIYVDSMMNASGETSALAGTISGLGDILRGFSEDAKQGGGGSEILATGLKGVVIAAAAFVNGVQTIAEATAGLVTMSMSVSGAIGQILRESVDGIGRYQDALLNLDFKGAAQAIIDSDKRILAIGRQTASEVQTNLSAIRDAYERNKAELATVMEQLNKSLVSNKGELESNAGANRELSEEQKRLQERIQALMKTLDSKGESMKKANASIKAQTDLMRLAAQASGKFESVEKSLAAQLGGANSEAATTYAERLAVIDEWERRMLDNGPPQIEMLQRITSARLDTAEALRREQEAAREIAISHETHLESMRQELAELTMTAEQREINNALREHENELKKAGIDLNSEEARTSLAVAEATARQIVATRQQIEVTSQYQGIITNGFGAAADVMADFITGGIKSFSDFGRALKDIAKRMVADMIAQFLRLRVIQPLLNGLFGMGGSGGATSLLGTATSALSGGGGGGWLSSLLGSGGAGGSSVGMIGPALPWLGALGGAAYGFQNPGNNAGATAARVGSYGYAGYALGTVGYGALLGGAAGAATGAGIGATVGGAASGAMGAAAAIPVVGWIIAALALIDAVSGGKLFGTKYQTKAATSSLNLGPDGASASVSLYQERQAALFGGIRRRTQTRAATPEMIAAANSLFDSIQTVMIDSARQLEIDVPPMIDASLRTVNEYDKKGKVKATKYFVDVLGRSFEEKDAETAGTRLAAEAILATIASSVVEAAPSVAPVLTPEQVADMVVGPMTGDDVMQAFDREGGGRFTIRDGGGGARSGAGAAATAAAAITNEVHRIAERWRSDAELLMKGAQFLLTAQTDVVRGYQLLGDTQTLTGVTDLVEDLQRGQEDLVDTYARVKASAQLFDEALRLSGVNLERTREEIVRFAVDISDAAGGLDAARQLWNTYFEGFYTASERAAVATDQLMETFTAGIEELGLSADVNLETFREAFENGMPTMDAAQIAEWLTFAQTMLAVQQRRDALAAAEAQYAEWLQAMTLSISSTPTAFQQSIAEIHGATAQYIADANALAQARGLEGASTTDLALIHRWAANQVRRAIAELERSTRDLVNQLGYSGLTAIETQIAQLEQLSQSGSSAISDNIANLFEQFRDGLQSLTDYANGLFVGDLSPYSLEQQLAESRARLEALTAAARGGDIGAMGQLQGASDQFLRLSQRFNASGSDYGGDFDFVQSLLRSITNPYSPGGGAPPVELVPSAQLLALYQERDRIMAEQDAARRLELATQLADQLRELSQVTGETVFGAADRMGVNFAQFITDLGANAAASTAAQVAELGNVANALNVELPELAEALALSLGSLADMNSLMNDAFEGQLSTLPEGFREQLEPALRSLEQASSTEESDAALARLNELTEAMPEQFRLQLAPYLSAIDPIDVSTFTDLQYLSSLDATSRQSRDILTSILDELRTQPAQLAQMEGKAAAKAGAEQATQVAILDELRALREESAKMRAEIAQLRTESVGAIKNNTDRRAGDLRSLGDAVKGNARSNR